MDQSWWQWMNNICGEADMCIEANDRRILKQKIESQLYSTAGDGIWSFEDWGSGEYSFSTLQGESNIVLTSREYARNVIHLSLPYSYQMLRRDAPDHDTKKPIPSFQSQSVTISSISNKASEKVLDSRMLI